MKSTRSALELLLALLCATAALSVLGCDEFQSPGQPEKMESAGIIYDRIIIANQSGDVKLAGDIDGDGLPDLILGGFPENALSWWRWPDLRRTVIATPQNEFSTDGALADLDSDGDIDVVTADGPDGMNLVWFENPSETSAAVEGAPWRRHEIGAIGDWVKDLKVADFDADGRLDIAARSPKELMIFFASGTSGWERVLFPGFELGEEGMGIGDVDRDGDSDLVLRGEWISNPGSMVARNPKSWRSHLIGEFNSAFKALVVDLDQDGHPDILTSSSEHTADVVWFRADDRKDGHWTRNVIQQSVSGAHTLQAADMDGDGDVDVVVGQMHTTKERILAVYYNVDGRGTRWVKQDIDNTGLHNGVVIDVDGDGDFDIYGSNWVGNPPLRLWINRLDRHAPPRRLDRWRYHRITGAHDRSFGMSFSDIDGDGRTDIVSGSFWYRQPVDPWVKEWVQHRIGEGIDGVAAIDLDGDGRAEIIAQRGGDEALKFVWLKAKDASAKEFDEHLIGEVPVASHKLGSQGHALAQIVAGGRLEIAVSSGGGVFYFSVPEKLGEGAWLRTRICKEASDEGIALGDVDGDGLIDLVAARHDAKEIAWWRNPGDGSSDWERHFVGSASDMIQPDRVAVGDLDGDYRLDIIVTEENGKANGAKAYWWRNPSEMKALWERHKITSRGSLNSLTTADMNGDGNIDLITGEHRGALRVSVWNNLGGGRFIEQLIGQGAESHLGARAVDLDNDGDLDIVSIAWDEPGSIHVWRNDANPGPK